MRAPEINHIMISPEINQVELKVPEINHTHAQKLVMRSPEINYTAQKLIMLMQIFPEINLKAPRNYSFQKLLWLPFDGTYLLSK